MSQHRSTGVWWMCFFPCLRCNEWNLEGVNLVAQRTNCLISSSLGDSKNTHFNKSISPVLTVKNPGNMKNANEVPSNTQIKINDYSKIKKVTK